MAEKKRMAVDFERDPALYNKVKKIVKKLDTDNSKFIRFALRKVVSEIENDKNVAGLETEEMGVTSRQ